VVSAGGFIYCLDASTGEQLWDNPLTGFACGVAALATVTERTPDADIAAAAAAQAAQTLNASVLAAN
jgi:outer membrane protein assembly factor BamB